MKITVRIETGAGLAPQQAGRLAAPALALLQQEIDAEVELAPEGASEDDIVRAALERLRARGLIATE